MSQHTKGPWVVSHRVEIRCPHEDNTVIATMEDSREAGWNTPTINANARLIAAAPDIYHALQDLITYLGVDVDNGLDELLTNARAAIAKATEVQS